MKQYLKSALVIILTLLLILTPTTNAESVWPTSIADEDVSIDITGIDLKVYSTEEIVKTNTEDGLETETTTVEKTLIQTIPLSVEEHPVTAKATQYYEDENKFTFVKLDLELTKEQIETYTKQVVTNIVDGEEYAIDLVARYKINKYPEKYKYAYQANFMEALNSSLQDIDYKFPLLDVTKEISQVLNTAGYASENGTTTFTYQTEVLEENAFSGPLLLALNYTLLTEEECTGLECENIETGHKIMLATVENMEILFTEDDDLNVDIDDMIEELNSEEPVEAAPKTEVVEVEDTSSSFATAIYLTGVVVILLSSFIIYKVIQKKQSNKEHN